MDTHIPDEWRLPYETAAALSDYQATLDKRHELDVVIGDAKQFLEKLKNGLPPNLRLMTQLQFMTEPYPPTDVYRRAGNGEWTRHGAVVAEGGHEPFYADGGFMRSNQLILTDSVNNWGVWTKGMRIEVVDIVSREPN